MPNQIKKCDHPNCKNDATHKAPKDRALKNYYWFCLKHVSEYNKSWNYYAGMSIDEIECDNKGNDTWHVKTKKFGINLDNLMKNGKLCDPLEIYETYMKGLKPTVKLAPSPKYTAQELSAIKVLELTAPINLKEIKAKYKKLVKIHHPDLNHGSKKSEEKFKIIVESYHVLIKKFDVVK